MAIKLIEQLWSKHYVAGITGSYHGDMAIAFSAILADSLCDGVVAHAIRSATSIHCRLERTKEHVGRKYFCEQFGTPAERTANFAEATEGA